MIGNKYKYGICDLSYILSRSNFSYTAHITNPDDFNPGDVVKSFIQTLNKCARDFDVTCDKYILFKDTWSKEYKGYYRTKLLGGNYKDSRVYVTDEIYNQIKSDPNSSQEEIDKTYRELCVNKCKNKAKNIIVYELGKFGIPCISVDSLEYDDLATLTSFYLSSHPQDKPSVFITKDSDLKWSTSPSVNWFAIPKSGSKPETYTFESVYNEMPEILRNSGIAPYNYNAVRNALGDSHNDMRRTKKDGVNSIEASIRILLRGDYSDINPEFMEVFENQRKSYDLPSFPKYDEAMDKIINVLPVTGRLGSLDEFHDFCKNSNITGISDRYFNEFIGRLDKTLYTGNDY